MCNDSPEIFGGRNIMYNHDADSEACLNRRILNNPVKRKSIGELVWQTEESDTQRTTKPVLGYSRL
jgi:hypothetical protein